MTTFADQLLTSFAPIASNYDNDEVAAALSWAETEVTEYCNRSFDLVTGAVDILDPAVGSAILNHVPVVNITLVEGYLPVTNGMQWTTLTNYLVKKDTGLIFDSTGLPGTPWMGGRSWPWLPASLRVTYDHGYDPVPRALIDVAMRLGRQYLENPELQVQLRVGDIEQRFSGAAGVTVNDMDKRILDRFTIVSVA